MQLREHHTCEPFAALEFHREIEAFTGQHVVQCIIGEDAVPFLLHPHEQGIQPDVGVEAQVQCITGHGCAGGIGTKMPPQTQGLENELLGPVLQPGAVHVHIEGHLAQRVDGKPSIPIADDRQGMVRQTQHFQISPADLQVNIGCQVILLRRPGTGSL